MRLSCLINLIDRCDDEIMDEFRFKCLQLTENNDPINSISPQVSFLQYLSKQFASKSINSEPVPVAVELKSMHRSLHALVLGFISRKNRTNLEVMRQSFDSINQIDIDHFQEEILLLVTNFTDQLQKNNNNNSKKCPEQELIFTRLNEIIVTLTKK